MTNTTSNIFSQLGETGTDVLTTLLRNRVASSLCKQLKQSCYSFPVCQPKHEPTDFEITYKSGCLGERNAKANHSS